MKNFKHFIVVSFLLLLSESLLAQWYAVGTGTSTTTSFGTPYNLNASGGKRSLIYLASELTAAGFSAGNIEAIGFQAATTGGPLTINGLVIRMAHTTVTQAVATFASNATGAFSTVYTASAPIVYTNTGWKDITLDNMFVWDGTSNIAIEICYTSTTGTALGFRYTSFSSPNQKATYLNGGANCAATTGTVDTWRANARFYRTPPSCSGTPTATAGTPASQVSCTGGTPASITDAGASIGPGITYQWEEGPSSSGPWTNATGGSGATTTTYTPPAFAGTTIYYRLVVTCTNSGLSAASTPAVVQSLPTTNVTLPYTGTGLTNCGFGNNITSTNAPVCGSSNYYGGEDRTFTFTPATSGDYVIAITTTSTYTGLMLYNGIPLTCGGGTCVANSQSSTGNKTMTVSLTAGVTYYLVVDSWPSPSCHPSFDLSITPPPPPSCSTLSTPANNATNVVVGSAVTWAASSSATSYDVYWGTSTPPSMVANVTTTTYTPAGQLPNTLYYWYIVPRNSAGPAVGCDATIFSYTTGALPLSNSICDAPEVTVGGGGVAFTTSGANTETGESTFCTPPTSSNGPSRGNANWNVNSASLSTTVWAKFTAPASGNVEILATTSSDSQMGLFKGAPTGCPTPNFSGMSHLQSNDDDIAGTGFQSRIRARLNPGEVYYVLIDGYTTSTPSGTLTITEMASVTQNDGIGDIYTTTPVQPGHYEVTSDHPSDQGWSYYYYNNGTTSNLADDKVVLALKKNGNNIGIYSVSATGTPSFSQTAFQVWGGLSAAGASNLSSAPYVSSGISWAMMNRYWNVVPQIQPGSAVTVRTFYQDADWTALQAITTGFSPSNPLTNKTDMVWVKFNKNSGHWNNTDLNPTGGQSGLTTALGTIVEIPSGAWTNTVLSSGVNQAEFSVTSFSGGGAGGGTGTQLGPLPVEIKSFAGKALNSSNLIEWSTATEINVREHIVERSVNGYSDWTAVGTVASQGDARELQYYSLEDSKPFATTYYRLRVVDVDGTENLSNIVSVTRQNNQFGVVVAYPNPASEVLNIQFNTEEEGNVMARVTDMTGRVLAQQQMGTAKGGNIMPLQVSQLAAGTYFVTLHTDTQATVPVRFIVK
jgi:hypothetical protein